MKNIILLLLLPLYLLAGTQKISVQLEWKHQFEYAGFYAAIEQGYYKESGLEVELREFEDGLNISSEVMSGRSTFGVSSSSLILEKLQNKPVVLLASYFKQNALVLLTKPEIKSPQDLKDKTIMALPSEMSRTALGVMLQENQITHNDYKLVHHDYSVDKFINGEIDAMSAFLTNQPYLLDKKNVKYNILNPANFGIYSYDLELFTCENTFESNPEMVRKFVQASNKGWEYAFSHKDEIVNLIYEKYSKRKTKDALLFEANKTQKLFKTNIFKIGSVVDELTVLNADIYKKLGLVKKNVNAAELLSTYSLNRIQTESKNNFNLSYDELAFLKKGKVLKIANEMDWPPFDYNEFGKPKGLSIEYIKLLLDKAGIKYEFVNGYNWEELLQMFKDKKIDIIPAIYKNEERKNFTNFTSPYYQGKLAVFSLNEYGSINSIDELKYKKVGVQKGDGSIPIIKKHLKNSHIIEIKSNNELVKQLASKNIDAIVGNPMLFYYYMKENKLSTIHHVDYITLDKDEQDTISMHVGVSKELPHVYTILQKTINSLSDTDLVTLKKQWQIDEKYGNVELNPIEREYLATKEIKMCIDPDWMPFEKLENGQHVGMSADFFKLIEKNLDTAITVVPTVSWTQSIEYAKQRKCDLFSLAMQTDERKKYMNFTTPYLNTPLVIATKLDVPFIAEIETVKNETIGIPKGYAYAEILKRKYPNLNIVDVENVEDGLDKVKDGKLFGYIGTLASVGYKFQTQYTGELKIAGKFNDSWKLGVAVRNDDKILLDIIQKAIDSISETEKRAILNKWIAINYNKELDYTIVWQIIFAALAIILGTLYWNRKLSNLNSELELAKNKAEDATKVKANFLANMSHEIRTPMNSIVGMIYMVQQTNLSPTQENYIKNIQSSSNNLLKLLNDILDYSKMEAKKLELNKINFNLTELLDDVNNIVEIDAYDKGLYYKTTYDKSETLCLYGDNLRILQILINIVSNAIKFTDEGGVELILKKVSLTRYRFIITDTGIGIKDEEVGKLFSSFTQADSGTTRKYGGTGLGLAISKQLVELMNGSIRVESEFGKGSSFIFEVELESCEEHNISQAAESKKEDISPNKGKKKADDKLTDELFERLKEAASKKRPQLCKPLIEEIEEYKLKYEKQNTFENVKKLIQKYKFDEARRLLDE